MKKILGNDGKRVMSVVKGVVGVREEEEIEEIKYVGREVVGEVEGGKKRIVDVVWRDVRGRKLWVEMEMEWWEGLEEGVVLNGWKLYVSEGKKGGK